MPGLQEGGAASGIRGVLGVPSACAGTDVRASQLGHRGTRVPDQQGQGETRTQDNDRAVHGVGAFPGVPQSPQAYQRQCRYGACGLGLGPGLALSR